jgi:hypothetical protein
MVKGDWTKRAILDTIAVDCRSDGWDAGHRAFIRLP